MINFACEEFSLDSIIKCGLGLTRTELIIMQYFLKDTNKECTTTTISKVLSLNLTTIQKAVKKLSDKKIILRKQKNLQNGGYIYTYESNSKSEIRSILKSIIRTWSSNIEKKIDLW